MSSLLLIRHGQASFGAADYDVLSDLGARQAVALGTHLASQRLDAVYVGPRRRQRDTARHMVEAARAAGGSLPEPIEVDELDEYPGFEILTEWLPRLRAADPALADLDRNLDDPRRLERAFEIVISRWARGEIDTGDRESFASFAARVGRGIARIQDEQGRGRVVAAVTSGGPIAVAMQQALGLAADVTMRVAWVIANASLSEFRWRDRGLGLVGFNATHHLAAERLVTYR